MESSNYNSIMFKVQSLEKKLNMIIEKTRGSHDPSVVHLSKRSHHYESIQNLLELAKSLKHELNCSLNYNPGSRQALKMYNKVCILESELYNLVKCIEANQNTNTNPKGSYKVFQKIPKKVSSDFSEVFPRSFPKRYRRQSISFAPQELKTKTVSDKYFVNITKPEYFMKNISVSDSFGASSYLSLSSESSSSTVTISQNREPLYTRMSKSSYQEEPSAPRSGRRSPERIPIYIEKSRDSDRRKRDRKTGHKPKKDSPLQLRIRKSDSNRVNVRADELQPQETEVFLIKKKRKPRPRKRSKSGENSKSGRYFISRLKKVMSRKSMPLMSERNKSPKNRKSPTLEHREKKYYIKKHSNKGLGISKFKENYSGSDHSTLKYSENSLYNEGKRRKKPFQKWFVGPKKYVKSKKSNDFKAVTVARSSNFNNSPFHDTNHILYLQDSSFILFPREVLNKDIHFSTNNGNGEIYSRGDNETPIKRSFMKPVKLLSNHQKKSLSNTDSTYEILGSYENVKGHNGALRKHELSDLSFNSRYSPHLRSGAILPGSLADRRINKHDSLDGKKKAYVSNSNFTNKCQKNENFNEKLILLKVVNDPIQFEDKESRISRTMNLNSKDASILFGKRQILNKDKSVYSNQFGVGTTATSIYLASVPQTLPLNTNIVQNPPSSNGKTQSKINSFNYTVNSAADSVLDNKSLHSLNSLNPIQTASSSIKSSSSRKSINALNKKLLTLNKKDSKIFPIKTVSKVSKNSQAEAKGTKATSQNTKSLSRDLPLAEGVSISRDQSHVDAGSLSGGSTQSSAGKKIKQSWLPRSLSKLSIASKRSKKSKKDKGSILANEASKNLHDTSKQISEEKKPSSEKISKAKSWTSFKRTMSGVGSFLKRGKTAKTENEATTIRSESKSNLKKQPSLLKRVFSKVNRSKSKTQTSDDTEVEISSTGLIGISGYEGDKTSSTSPSSLISNPPPKASNNNERLGSKKLPGYQVASKMGKKGSTLTKGKYQSILSPSSAKTKKLILKDNPEAFNYSLHYSKEKRNCVEMDLVPSISCLVYSRCPQTVVKTCGSKDLWSMGETVLSEHELNEFDKHNKYYEFFFKPNKCKGCFIYDKKVSKVCQKRDERKSLDRPSKSGVCNYSKVHLYSDNNSYFKNIPVSKSDHVLSDSSDVCDWKEIANKIKENP